MTTFCIVVILMGSYVVGYLGPQEQKEIKKCVQVCVSDTGQTKGECKEECK